MDRHADSCLSSQAVAPSGDHEAIHVLIEAEIQARA